MQMTINDSQWYEPMVDSPLQNAELGGACVQDWYEQALQSETPIKPPSNSWGVDDEDEVTGDDVEETDDEDIQADPFDDFDPEDFDDEFDDDFEEELQDEYDIEPADDEILEVMNSPGIKIGDIGAKDDDDPDLEDLDVTVEEIDEELGD